jgi:hypothetical protein
VAPPASPTPRLVVPRTRPAIRVIARAVVPEAASLDESGWASFERLLEGAVSARPAGVARQLRAFLRILGFIARVRHGRGLADLTAREAGGLLERLAASRLLLLRRGVWGLRTLMLLGYYADDGRARALGYRASPAGWSARA